MNKKPEARARQSSISRRGFLAGAALAPVVLLGNTNKSGSRVVLGTGTHTLLEGVSHV